LSSSSWGRGRAGAHDHDVVDVVGHGPGRTDHRIRRQLGLGRRHRRGAARAVLEDVVTDGLRRGRAACVVEGGVDDHVRQPLREAREIAEQRRARFDGAEPAPDLIPAAAGAGDQEAEEREARVEGAGPGRAAGPEPVEEIERAPGGGLDTHRTVGRTEGVDQRADRLRLVAAIRSAGSAPSRVHGQGKYREPGVGLARSADCSPRADAVSWGPPRSAGASLSYFMQPAGACGTRRGPLCNRAAGAEEDHP
jgi:hypothetical protein